MARWGRTAVALLLVAAAGCGSAGHPAETLAVGPVATHTESAGTAHLTATTTLSGAGTPAATTTSGVVDFATHTGAFRSASTDLLVVGTTTYSSLGTGDLSGALPGKRWLSSPSPVAPEPGGRASVLAAVADPEAAPDPSDLLQLLATQATSETEVGRTSMAGTPVTEYRLVLRTPPGACSGSLGPAYLWVDGQGRARRTQLQIAFPDAGSPVRVHITSTITYDDFGVPVSVSAPPADEVETEQQYRQQEQAQIQRQELASGAHPLNLYGQGQVKGTC